MKKRYRRKLSLNKQTIRDLNEDALSAVRGGGGVGCDCDGKPPPAPETVGCNVVVTRPREQS